MMPSTQNRFRDQGNDECFLPIAMAMGIRNVLASSGVARKIISVGHVYWHDVSCWCTLVPRLCRYTTGTIHLDVCSHLCYVAFGVDYSHVVKYIRTKTVSIGIYTLCIVCRNCLCLFVWQRCDHCFQNDFKWQHDCTQK